MYFYLEKNSLLKGEAVVIFQTENQIPNYKEIINFGELVEYSGDNIPANWEYSESEDILYDINDKPSPYHILKNKKWIVEDKEGFKKYCNNRIDTIKADILKYGFDYKVDGKEHRQRCRDKDIIWIAMTALLLFLVKTFMGKEIKKTWYFEDDYGKEMDLMGFIQLMFFGSTFIQSVYDTENFFKTKVNPKEVTKEEFEAKRKEIHFKLANG